MYSSCLSQNVESVKKIKTQRKTKAYIYVTALTRIIFANLACITILFTKSKAFKKYNAPSKNAIKKLIRMENSLNSFPMKYKKNSKR
jgi:hypothetical protein